MLPYTTLLRGRQNSLANLTNPVTPSLELRNTNDLLTPNSCLNPTLTEQPYSICWNDSTSLHSGHILTLSILGTATKFPSLKLAISLHLLLLSHRCTYGLHFNRSSLANMISKLFFPINFSLACCEYTILTVKLLMSFLKPFVCTLCFVIFYLRCLLSLALLILVEFTIVQ